MVSALHKLFISGRKRVVATVLTVGVLGAGSLALLQPALTNSRVAAASCDAVNIVYCGFSASSDSGYISDLRTVYNRGSDHGHGDLKTVYRWAGASDASIKGMTTDNTKLGTMDNHGNITVSGKKVGLGAKMAARFKDSSWTGVVHVGGDIYARTVTPSSTEFNSYKVLVHFNKDGVADFAVAVTCGNAIKFTPVVPKPQLSCDSLTFSLVNKEDRSYEFHAKASAKNTKITSYNFHFGDGKSNTVKTSKLSASTKHSFAKNDHSYSAYVVVNSTRKSGVTSAKCHVTVKTPKAPVKPSLTCVSLTPSIVADQANTYKFTAKAKASHTAITSYVFDFGDGSSQTVHTNADSATSEAHAFTDANKTYTVKVSVSSKDLQNVTSASCETTITTPPTSESPQLICQNLSFVAIDGQANTYKFTANADAANTEITSYDFAFGDGGTQSVPTNQKNTAVTHTYADGSKSYIATVSVSSKDLRNVTNANCKVTIPHLPQQQFCKPGVPAGSKECETHVLAAATTLPNTGAGNVIGFFSATTIAGALLHRFLLRKRTV